MTTDIQHDRDLNWVLVVPEHGKAEGRGMVMSTDIQHDRDLCKHDAQIDAWEAEWDLLRASFIQAAIDCGFTPEGYATIAETAAADIIDLHRPSAEYENALDKIMLAGIDEEWIEKLGRK